MRHTIHLENGTVWRALDIRAIIRAGVSSHGIEEINVCVRSDGSPSPSPRTMIQLVLPARVSDVGLPNVWAPHEIDDDLAARVALSFARQVDQRLYWHRGGSVREDRIPAWYEPAMRLTAKQPTPKIAKAPPSKKELLERKLQHIGAVLLRASQRRQRAEKLEATWQKKLWSTERKLIRLSQVPKQENKPL